MLKNIFLEDRRIGGREDDRCGFLEKQAMNVLVDKKCIFVVVNYLGKYEKDCFRTFDIISYPIECL